MIESQHTPQFVTSERKNIGYQRDGDGYKLEIVWAEERPADPVIGREALPAAWILPGGERTLSKERVLRWCEEVCKALAGY